MGTLPFVVADKFAHAPPAANSLASKSPKSTSEAVMSQLPVTNSALTVNTFVLVLFAAHSGVEISNKAIGINFMVAPTDRWW